MDDRLTKACDRFIGGIGRLAASVGLNRVVGQLYAILFLSNKPLCLDDMIESLKISKGNASVNIRELERLGVVRKVWIKGNRRDFYEAELDFEKIITSSLTGAVKRRMKLALDTVTETESFIKEARTNLNKEEKKTVELYLKRLEDMKKIHNFAEKMLKMTFPRG